MSKFIYVII